jgi:hypothetical protein
LLSAGSFTMLRQATGQYKLTIPGESPSTGMLLLTVSKETTISSITAPDDNILNYQSDGLGNFLISSYDLTGSTILNYENTEFVWAFIDFTNPIRMPMLTMTWNAAFSGNWITNSWTGAPLPYPNSSVNVVVNTPRTVTVTGYQEANSLAVSGGGTVIVNAGATLDITTNANIASNGTLNINGTLLAPAVNVEGNLIAGDLSLTGMALDVTNGGTASVGALTGTGTLQVGGGSGVSTLTAESFTLPALTIRSSGKIVIQSAAAGGAAAVPEPAVWLLLLPAAGLWWAVRGRRNI